MTDDVTDEREDETLGDGEPGDEDLSYEEARERLVGIVTRLEGGAPLEESLTLWERGEELAALCRARLEHARERINQRTSARADESDGGPAGTDPD